MLMQLGPITFQVQPFNAHEIGHASIARYAEKPVLGTRPPLEFIGEGPEEYAVRATIFPHQFGGLDDLERLQQARASGKPQYMVRGDGRVLGWMAIRDVQERQTHLDARGVPQRIDIDIIVQRTERPEPGSYYSIVRGLFA